MATHSGFVLGEKKSGRKNSQAPQLWDGHLVEFEIHPHFLHSGVSLQKLGLREKFGVSLVAVIRGERKILAPGRDNMLMPFDRVIVLGTDPQLAKVEQFFHSERHDIENEENAPYQMEKIWVSPESRLVGKNLRQSEIREKVRGIVLGIERQGMRLLNPDSTIDIEAGDILWIYGDRERMRMWERSGL